MKTLILIPFLLALISSLSAQDFSERYKAMALDRESGDQFGASVSILGSQFLVGAPSESHNLIGSNFLLRSGSAYFFEKNAQGNWQQTQKIIASDRSAGARFGEAVILGEDVALIGAYQDSTGIVGDSVYPEAGAVYVFRKDSSSGLWQETQKLVASDRAAYDWFGDRIVMQGNIALISAWKRDNAGPGGLPNNQAGAVYAFEQDSQGFWQEVQILVITDTGKSENFGFSLAMDGDLALIGAPRETEDENGQNTERRAGAAYIWQRQASGQWQMIQKIVAPIRQYDIEYFGYEVAIEDSMVVIIQRVNVDFDDYVMSYLPDPTGAWKYQETILFNGQGFTGRTMFMKDSFLVVGHHPNQADRGRGYLLRMSPLGNWESVSDFIASDRREDDEFGYSVSMDDSTLIFGARYESPPNPAYGAVGAAYVFETCTPNYPEQVESICFGDSLWFEGDFFSEPGIYEALYQNVEGCDSLITLSLEVYPVVDTSIQQSPSQLMALATDASFQWLQCDSTGLTVISGETNALFIPSQSGEYALAVTNAQGCSDTSACLNFGPPLSIEPNWATDLTLFPNPGTGTVQLLFSQPQSDLQIRVLDLQGRTISSLHSVNPAAVRLELPGPAGLYLVEIQDLQGQRVYRKVVKQ